MSLLASINSPEDLKKLAVTELPQLAQEIRELIVSVISRNGGHLAPSLGTVELAIAIHYVFDVPQDQLVWDVGHQSYTHKILTGRRREFGTIRQHQGLSGFTKISESPYDAFSTGHSSTSIASALGLLAAKQQNADPGKVIAVIGDGSLTAGLAYESLNQAGDRHRNKNLLVILNDNEMSISPNVGAVSALLSKTLSTTFLQDWKQELKSLFKSVPRIGEDIYQFAKRSEETLKAFVTPGMLFEAFNLQYFGPIDGHRIKSLINMLQNLRELKEPVLLHVSTTKGKGYEPAEKEPSYFHGVGCFDIHTGQKIPAAVAKGPSYTQVFGQTLLELAQNDEKIIAITAAMPEGTGLVDFSQTYPERFFDVGIAEQYGVTFAAGMAAAGMKPVVAIYSTFLQRSYDQIIHDVCLEALPVTFALDRAGIVGEDGPTHHGLFDLSYLRSLPNMLLMAPADENELRRMLLTAIEHDGPAAIRYPRGCGTGVHLDATLTPVTIGQASQLTSGKDLLILALGRTVSEALAAEKVLSQEGIGVTVVNCRFVKPLDTELICNMVAQIPQVITVEDNVLAGGFSSAVLEGLSDAGVGGYRIKRLGIDDVFVEHGSQAILRSAHGIDAAGIVEAARKLLNLSG